LLLCVGAGHGGLAAPPAGGRRTLDIFLRLRSLAFDNLRHRLPRKTHKQTGRILDKYGEKNRKSYHSPDIFSNVCEKRR
jgi:hypothetical protein